MNRSSSTYSPTSGSSRALRSSRGSARPTGGFTDVETDVHDYDGHDVGYDDRYDETGYDETGYEYDDEVYEYRDEIDRRWIWVAGVAGAILLVAVICTVIILGGGDSGSVSKTITPPTPSASATATATASPAMTSVPPPVAPVAPLSPETVTTVAPSPSASVDAAPVPALPPASTVTYQVTGSRQMIDLVTVVYTDQQGALQTEFNVGLPWTRTVTLDPGVALSSVTATSLTGQLNCTITDSAGTTLVAQTTNSIIANCTK